MGHKRGHTVTLQEIGPVTKRPLIDVCIVLAAVTIMAVVILAPLFGGNADLAVAKTPWRAVATTALTYCIPCAITLAIAVLKAVRIRREIRYTFALISYMGLAIVVSLALMACVTPYQTESARLLLWAFRLLYMNGWWVIAILGVLMGLSLPAGKREPRRLQPYAHHRRTRMLVIVGALAWFFASYRLVYALVPSVVGVSVHSSFSAYIFQTIAGPSLAFFLAALISAIVWSFASFNNASRAFLIMRIGPLSIYVALALIALVNIVQMQGSFSLNYTAFRLSGAFVLAMCLLGIVFGAGLSAIED